MSFIKDNKFLAILAAAGTILIGIGSTTDAINKIAETTASWLFPKPVVTGSWSTDTIQRGPDYPTITYIFDFQARGAILTGTVIKVYDSGSFPYSIGRGRIDENTISFVIQYEQDVCRRGECWVELWEDTYVGTVSKNKIAVNERPDPRSRAPSISFVARTTSNS